jgi:hypothetical protein
LHNVFAAETRERLALVEGELGGVRHRLQRIEAARATTLVPHDSELNHVTDRLEERVSSLELQAGKPWDRLPANVARRIQQLCAPAVEDGIAKCQGVAERALAECNTSRDRVVELERWLAEVVTPELLRLNLQMGQRDISEEATGGATDLATIRERSEAMRTIFQMVDVNETDSITGEDIIKLREIFRSTSGQPRGSKLFGESLDAFINEPKAVVTKSEFAELFASLLPVDMIIFRAEVRKLAEAAQKMRSVKRRLNEDVDGHRFDVGDRDEPVIDDPALQF